MRHTPYNHIRLAVVPSPAVRARLKATGTYELGPVILAFSTVYGAAGLRDLWVKNPHPYSGYLDPARLVQVGEDIYLDGYIQPDHPTR